MNSKLIATAPALVAGPVHVLVDMLREHESLNGEESLPVSINELEELALSAGIVFSRDLVGAYGGLRDLYLANGFRVSPYDEVFFFFIRLVADIVMHENEIGPIDDVDTEEAGPAVFLEEHIERFGHIVIDEEDQVALGPEIIACFDAVAGSDNEHLKAAFRSIEEYFGSWENAVTVLNNRGLSAFGDVQVQ